MIEIACQIDSQYRLVPFSEEDRESIREYRPNQTVTCQIKGVRKPRSYLQLQWFHCMCRLVARNTEDQNWNTKEKVKLQIKALLGYYDPDCVIVAGGNVCFKYRSFGYSDLGHFEANKIFDRALTVMARFLGCTEQELLDMAKRETG